MLRSRSRNSKQPTQITIGLQGRVELIEYDLDGREVWRDQVKNTIKSPMLALVADHLANGTAAIPGWVAVGNGAVDSFSFDVMSLGRVLDSGSEVWLGQQFSVGATVSVAKIRLLMYRIAFSSATITVEIQTDSAGSPSGTVVTNGTSNAVAMNGLTTDTAGAVQEFEFATNPSLTSGTYWLVIKPSGYNPATESIAVLCDYLDAAEDTAKKWNGSAWSAYGSATAFGFDVVAAFDVTRTALRNELDRNVVSGATNPSTYNVRYTATFGPTEAVGYVSELGLMDAASGGNLLAYTQTSRLKTSSRVLLVIWTIDIVEVV